MSNFSEIVNNGTYYCPALKHYPNIPNAKINCDRCKKTNLDDCYGYLEQDLCMNCYYELRNITSNLEPVLMTQMMQNMFDQPKRFESVCTAEMMQDMFYEKPSRMRRVKYFFKRIIRSIKNLKK
jgi:hypothetical protein